MAARRINIISDGDYAPSNDPDWLRRVGPEANDERKKAVTAGRTARWILLLYGVCVVLWAASRGFQSTGEANLPNILLLGSALLVTAAEVVFTLREQRARRRLRRLVNAVLKHGKDVEGDDIIAGAPLIQMPLFDAWTTKYRLTWYDGTTPEPH